MTKTFAAITLSLFSLLYLPPPLFAIYNGVEISESEFPEVVKITNGNGGSCTATCVSNNTIITAAHCFNNRSFTITKYGASSVVTRVLPAYEGGREHDIAVGIFENDVCKDFASLYNKIPQEGQRVDMVGYGRQEDWGERQGGIKRHGYNTVESVSDDLLTAKWQTDLREEGHACPGPGDSGGPYLLEGKIAGVVSGRLSNSTASVRYAGYANISSTEAISFFQTMEAAGAAFCGFEGKQCNAQGYYSDDSKNDNSNGDDTLRILSDLRDRTVSEAANITLSVVARGTGEIEYEWQKDGEILSGEETNILQLNSLSRADSGVYRVTISNGIQSKTSREANVIVTEKGLWNVVSISLSTVREQDTAIYESYDMVLASTSSQPEQRCTLVHLEAEQICEFDLESSAVDEPTPLKVSLQTNSKS